MIRMPAAPDATPASTGSKLPVISLFAGAGGLDLAVERVADRPLTAPTRPTPGPFHVAVATDYAPQALDTLALNLPGTVTLPGDIRETTTSDLLRAGSLSEGDAALVVGGPPCTPFSKSGFWLAEKRESRDPNASLLEEYVRVVAQSRPEAFVLENVQALTYKTHQGAYVPIGPSTGWYVQVAAPGVRVGAGFYEADSERLAAIRHAIADDTHGAELEKLLADLTGEGWQLGGETLKTSPRGYDADHPRIALLRHKSMTLGKDYGFEPVIHTPELLDRVRDDWRAVRPFLDWVAAHTR